MTGARRLRPARRARGAAGGGARLRIGRARPGDAAAIARLMSASIRALAKGHHPARAIAAWSSLPALYHRWAMTAGGERYVVARRAGRLAGYAARRGREATAVFVHPREARRNVGAALLRRLEADARREGIGALFVRAAQNAVPFYAAMGYRPGRTIEVALPGGATLRAVLARKRLDAAAPRRPARR